CAHKTRLRGSLSPSREKGPPCSKPAVIQLRFARVRIIEHNKTDKLGVLGRKIAGERNNVFSFFISASRINLLCGSGFSSNGKTWHRGCGGGPAIAHDASECITNFSGGFRRNYLSQQHRRK